MSDNTFRTPFKRKMKSGKQYWYASIWDIDAEGWRKQPLFPARDPRTKDPRRSSPELEIAWEKVRSGKRPTALEAEIRAKELFEEINDLADKVSKSVTLPELVERELADGGVKGKRAVGTIKDRRRVLKRFEAFELERHAWVLRVDVRRIPREHVREFLSWRESVGGIGVRRKHVELGYLRRLFNFGLEEGLLEQNPTAGVRVPRPTTAEKRLEIQKKYLAPEHVEAILRAARQPYSQTRRGNVFRGTVAKGREVVGQVDYEKQIVPPRYLYPLILCLYHCGCRHGDLVETSQREPSTTDPRTGEVNEGRLHRYPGLYWERVDFTRRKFTVINKGKTRVVAMTPEVLSEFKKLQQEQGRITGPVFVHESGRAVKKRYEEWWKLIQRSGVPTWTIGRRKHPCPHDLRHSRATQMEIDGHDPYTIQEQLGHENLETTELYLHRQEQRVVDNVWRKAEEVDAKRRRELEEQEPGLDEGGSSA